MASLRRFTSLDSASKVKKQSRLNCSLADGSSSDEEDMQQRLELPHLLKLDTQSLINLFDAASNEEASTKQEFGIARLQQVDDEILKLPPKSSKRKTISAVPSRNDSTGSSSYSSRLDSDAFSLHSDVSSRSSLSLDESPSPTLEQLGSPRKFAAKREAVASRTTDDLATAYKDEIRDFSVAPLRPRRPLDLQKPLPPGPPTQATGQSTTDPSRPRTPGQDLFGLSESTGILVPSNKSRRGRPDTAFNMVAELSGDTPEIPTCRGARLGMSVYGSKSKARSRSADAIEAMEDEVVATESSVSASSGWNNNASPDSTLTSSRPVSRSPVLPPNDKDSATEYVAFLIMSKLNGLADLQAIAVTNKRFYASFKRNEVQLVSRVLYRSSRTAWEFRQTLSMHGQPDCFTLRDHRKGVATVTSIKSLLLKNCRSKLREETVKALEGSNVTRRARVNNALWRVWTFCLLFGRPDMRIGLFDAQIDWLNGGVPVRRTNAQSSFGIGNGSGLTTADFEDMSEIWQSLESLLSGFRDKKSEARSSGIFDTCNANSAEAKEWYLNEWIYHILSLGLGAVLALSHCDFAHAKALNLTVWSPPPPGHTSRSFLKEAIAQAYQQKVLAEATAKAARFSQGIGIGIDQVSTREQIPFHEPEYKPLKLPQSLKIKVQTTSTPATIATRPASDLILANEDTQIRPDCDPYSSVSPRSLFPTSPSNDPSLLQTLSIDGTLSARSSATLFDYNTLQTKTPLSSITSPTLSSRLSAEIIDPVDKAMLYLHGQLGFPEAACKKALATSDTGSGIDLQRALEILSTEQLHNGKINPLSRRAETMPPAMPNRKSSTKKSSKEYCEGNCKRTMTLSRVPTRSGRRFSSRRTIMSLTTIKDDADADADVSCSDAPCHDMTPRLKEKEPTPLEVVPRDGSSSPLPRRMSCRVSRMKRESVVKALKLLGIEDQNVIDNSESAMKAIKVLGIDDHRVLQKMTGSNGSTRDLSTSAVVNEVEAVLEEMDEDEE